MIKDVLKKLNEQRINELFGFGKKKDNVEIPDGSNKNPEEEKKLNLYLKELKRVENEVRALNKKCISTEYYISAFDSFKSIPSKSSKEKLTWVVFWVNVDGRKGTFKDNKGNERPGTFYRFRISRDLKGNLKTTPWNFVNLAKKYCKPQDGPRQHADSLIKISKDVFAEFGLWAQPFDKKYSSSK